MTNAQATHFLARHTATMADLDATFDGALIRIDRMVRDCPPAPTLHARINDAGLDGLVDEMLETHREVPQGVITGNADLVCERGDANPNPERPAQVYPLQSSESWTERVS